MIELLTNVYLQQDFALCQLISCDLHAPIAFSCSSRPCVPYDLWLST